MTGPITAVFFFIAFVSLAATRLGRKAASAPALLLIASAAISLLYRAVELPTAPDDFVVSGAKIGLGALVFAAAIQFRISQLSRTPAAMRLALGGAPLFVLLCGAAAYFLLPQLGFAGALLLGGALMVNGAAFDWRALARAPAPKSIKSAVRLEGAAILALGAPAAIFLAANASAAASGEPAAGPLLRASVAAVKGFAIGGCVSLCIVLASNWLGARAARNRARRIEGKTIALGALVVFFVAPMFGGDPVFACLAAGLVWSEETHARLATRIALRGLIERTVTPVTYVCFGALFAPRVLQADLLTIIFALIAVTVLRAAPRLAILSSNKITRESRFFLAWFGGAPGAASALFLMTLLNSQALADQDGVLTVGAVAVVAGVIAARLTSRPLTNGYIRAADVARRRRLFAE